MKENCLESKRSARHIPIAVFWSGGKDGYYACIRALQEGYHVARLVSLFDSQNKTIAYHPFSPALMRAQASSLGIPFLLRKIISQNKHPEQFERELERIMRGLIAEGIQGFCAGYIHDDYQRQLLKRICLRCKCQLLEPNFGKHSGRLLRAMVRQHVTSIVTEVMPDKISPKWLGKKVGTDFVNYISTARGIDPCGDYGEYHSLVIDAPFFSKRLKIGGSCVYVRENAASFFIRSFTLIQKKRYVRFS
ncbi:MAG TPA: hypothetical protein PKL77_10680 [Candidatus Omnitrophota bacterium]|nr:hypothetical protein [Candidatus Omnitrophota bacterium]